MVEELIKYNNSEALFTRELEENATWFNGSPPTIEYFFKNVYHKYTQGIKSTVRSLDSVPNFWNQVSGDIPRIHSGLPALISRTWVRLIKPRSMIVTVNHHQEWLDEVLKDNQFRESILPKLIATTSWGGYSFLKVSQDDSISEYPIIEAVDPRYGKVVAKRGRVQEYKFTKVEIIDDEEVIIEETYSLKDNRLTVEYEGFKIVHGEKKKTSLPDGYKNKILSYSFLPAELFNNTPYNSRFPNAIYGESDYSNIQSLLHELDSILSNTQLDVDNAKSKTFINDDLLEKDEQGRGAFDRNKVYITLASKLMQDPNFDLRKMIAMLQPEVRTEHFNKTAKEVTGRIAANVGLSTISLGLPGFESVDAAADSQRARKETSIVSRDEKVSSLTETLEKFFVKVLKMKEDKDYEITVEFDKYGSPSFEDLVDAVKEAVGGKVMSIRQAVERLYPDKSEEEWQQIVLDIKSETMTPFVENDLQEGDVDES